MYRLSRLALCTSLALSASAPAFAYTPESGVYWNPEEAGTGLQIEIQDNFLVLSGYLFLPDGAPTFVTVQGFLDDTAMRFASTDNPSDGSSANTFRGGQCFGCAYMGPPQISAGALGPVVIEFDPEDETRAMITWGGRTTSIERYQFGLVRPTDQEPIEITKMLGEWSTTIDFNQNTQAIGRRFDGDVLVVDQVGGIQSLNFFTYEGCRPDDSLFGFCSDDAFASDEVAGTFDSSTGRHMMLVNNGRADATDSDSCLLYEVKVRTNDFSGGIDGDLDSGNDGGVTSYRCGAANVMDLDAYPVRGFRSASRSFVETGTGPSKVASVSAVTPRVFPLSALRTTLAPTSSAAKAERVRRTTLVRELEQRLARSR